MKSFKTAKGTDLPISNLKGKDYLLVAHRIVWFREDHPDWSIETELLVSNSNEATCKAWVKDPSGRVIATGHKTETQEGFPYGHAEKAETGAIGRALALCGYGTQFAPDLQEDDMIVDSPIERKPRPTITSSWTEAQMREFSVLKWGKSSSKDLSSDQLAELVMLSKSKPFKVAMNDLGAK